MCEPASIIMIATAVYGAYTTRQNAKKQEKATRQAAKIRSEEEYAQKSAQANERHRLARAEKARLRAMSAESGVGGLSIADVLDNVDMQAGMDIATIGGNEYRAQRGLSADTQSRLNSIEQPDYVATGLQVAGYGYQGYQTRYGDKG
jgi:hypothetical protein